MSKDVEYKLHLRNNKGLISTTKKKISERHKSAKNAKMIIHGGLKIQVFKLLTTIIYIVYHKKYISMYISKN